MALQDKEIGEILLGQSYISEEELGTSLKEAATRNVDLLTVLMEKGFLTQSLYENALAEHYKLPFYDINENPPRPDLITKLPEDISREYGVIVVGVNSNTITVATSDPGEPTLEEAIRLNFEQEEAVLPKAKEKEMKKDGEHKKQKKGFFSKNTNDRKEFAGNIEYVFTAKTPLRQRSAITGNRLPHASSKLLRSSEKLHQKSLAKFLMMPLSYVHRTFTLSHRRMLSSYASVLMVCSTKQDAFQNSTTKVL